MRDWGLVNVSGQGGNEYRYFRTTLTCASRTKQFVMRAMAARAGECGALEVDVILEWRK